MHFFRTISEALKKSDGSNARPDEAFSERAERLAEITYADVLREQAVYGTPEAVAGRLLAPREALRLSGPAAWVDAGGPIPPAGAVKSVRLLAASLAPR